MEKIKKVIDEIYDEIEAAENYTHLAEKYHEDSDAYSTFHKLAEQELSHVLMLHQLVTAWISAYKSKSNKEVPEDMKAIWNYEHERQIKKYNEIRNYLLMLN